jgi:hypothetical protein
MLVETPFVLDVTYLAEDIPTPPLVGESYSAALDFRKAKFDKEFEDKFGLLEKG